jgi:hypothetical protein
MDVSHSTNLKERVQNLFAEQERKKKEDNCRDSGRKRDF